MKKKPKRFLDFKLINRQATASIDLILKKLLPEGQWQGNEYIAINPTRHDRSLGSFRINRSGVWCDFAIDKKGRDPISLVAYIREVDRYLAALIIVEELLP